MGTGELDRSWKGISTAVVEAIEREVTVEEGTTVTTGDSLTMEV